VVLFNPFTKMMTKSTLLALACIIFALWGCGAGKASKTPMQEAEVNFGAEKNAIAGLRASLASNQKARDRQGELAVLISLGKALTSSGEYKEAQDELARAIKLAGKLKDSKGLADSYGTLAEARLKAGNPEAALESIDRAVEIDSKLGYPSQARLNLKGLVLLRTGRPAEAIDALKSASGAAGGDTELLSDNMRLSGIASRQTGSDALWYFSEAYRLDRELGRTGKVAFDLEQLAELNFESGRYDEALFLFERSYSAYMEAGATDMAIRGLDRLIEAAKGLGRYEKALYYSGIREDLLRNRKTVSGEKR